ncbi:hypothetical protein VPH35_126573 [Triticum aestivum]
MEFVDIPTKHLLEQFVALVGFPSPVLCWRPAPDRLYIVGVQVDLGLEDRVPHVYYEATRATIPEAEQAACLMVIHAVAAERNVEIRDINYYQLGYLRHQVDDLRKKLMEAEHLCAEPMNIVRSSESEVSFLERLTHSFCRCILCPRDTVAALQHGGIRSSSPGSSSGSV